MVERKIFSSWKEIANYLGINTRTAQRWEKLGLPVYRVDESQKTSILAYADEIDKWIKEQNGKETVPSEKRNRTRRLSFIVIVLFFAVFIAFFSFMFFPKFLDNKPVNFKIEGSTLIVHNKSGKKLWDYEIDGKFVQEAYEPQHPDVPKSMEIHNIFFEDIDRDGCVNVVFAVQTEENIGEKVVCFDHKGRPLWSCPAGREIKYGNQNISSDFDIQKFRIVDLDSDGFLETVVIASHKLFHPSRVLVLDHQGNIRGEYWNSGHLESVVFLDLDQDGLHEILMGGLNNTYAKACLVVLDCRRIEGSSPNEEGTRYHAEELMPGTEKYYILFPQNELGRSIVPYETIGQIELYDNGRISAITTHSRVFFEFDYRLRPTLVLLGDEFRFKYRKLKREGKIETPLDSFDAERIKSEILYWDGKSWTNEPTRTELWKTPAD